MNRLAAVAAALTLAIATPAAAGMSAMEHGRLSMSLLLGGLRDTGFKCTSSSGDTFACTRQLPDRGQIALTAVVLDKTEFDYTAWCSDIAHDLSTKNASRDVIMLDSFFSENVARCLLIDLPK